MIEEKKEMSTIKKWQTMPTKNDETKLNDLAKKLGV